MLLLTCATFIAYELMTFRQSLVRNLTVLGEVIADNSTAALAFDNNDDAAEVLAALKAERHVVAAGLYDAHGQLFATYPESAPPGAVPLQPEPDGYRFEHGHLVGLQPVVQGARRLGTLYLGEMPEPGQLKLSAELTALLRDVLAGREGPLPRLRIAASGSLATLASSSCDSTTVAVMPSATVAWVWELISPGIRSRPVASTRLASAVTLSPGGSTAAIASPSIKRSARAPSRRPAVSKRPP